MLLIRRPKVVKPESSNKATAVHEHVHDHVNVDVDVHVHVDVIGFFSRSREGWPNNTSEDLSFTSSFPLVGRMGLIARPHMNRKVSNCEIRY